MGSNGQEGEAMAMTMCGTSRQKAEINVTPMIDVLLVLLIIFMLVAPISPKGLNALVPQPAPPDANPLPRPADVVITVARDGAIEINREAVEMSNLPARLARIFEVRGDIVIFLRGERELEFGSIARVMDIARGVGLDRVALMTSR
jgi:biopolymer transport protein TolR